VCGCRSCHSVASYEQYQLTLITAGTKNDLLVDVIDIMPSVSGTMGLVEPVLLLLVGLLLVGIVEVIGVVATVLKTWAVSTVTASLVRLPWGRRLP
jgi:hypothetical protein